jgi:hypothetical protein
VTPQALQRLEQFARHFKLRRIKLGTKVHMIAPVMTCRFHPIRRERFDGTLLRTRLLADDRVPVRSNEP